MGVTVNWDNQERTVLRYTYSDPWTWNDVYEAIGQGHELMDAISHTVDIISDMRNGKLLPGGTMNHVKNVSKLMINHPRTGVIVIVGAGKHIDLTWNILKTVASSLAQKLKVEFVPSIEGAYAILEQRYEKLSPLP